MTHRQVRCDKTGPVAAGNAFPMIMFKARICGLAAKSERIDGDVP